MHHESLGHRLVSFAFFQPKPRRAPVRLALVSIGSIAVSSVVWLTLF